jgi:hypothetical protein
MKNQDDRNWKFCPLTRKACRRDCMLLVDGERCSISVMANELFAIADLQINSAMGITPLGKEEANNSSPKTKVVDIPAKRPKGPLVPRKE